MDCIISTLLNDNMIVKLGYIESQFILPMVGCKKIVLFNQYNLILFLMIIYNVPLINVYE